MQNGCYSYETDKTLPMGDRLVVAMGRMGSDDLVDSAF